VKKGGIRFEIEILNTSIFLDEECAHCYNGKSYRTGERCAHCDGSGVILTEAGAAILELVKRHILEVDNETTE